MLALVFILAIQPPHVPGAVSFEVCSNLTLVKSAKRSLWSTAGISVFSNEGNDVFVNEGKITQYILDNPAFRKREDIFYSISDGKPKSLTTSQYSHVFRELKARPLDRGTRDVYAANTKQTFVGTNLNEDVLRLTIVNLNERGLHPNQDFDVQPKSVNRPAVMAVDIDGGTVKWFVIHSAWSQFSPNTPSIVEALHVRNGRSSVRRLGTCASGGFTDFDPKTNLLLGNGMSDVTIGRLGSPEAIKTAQPERPGASPLNTFLWRGKVMAQTDRLYVRDSDRKWKPFGSEFVVLAKSANDKYWLILDQNEQAWKVTF